MVLLICPQCRNNIEFSFNFEGLDILYANWFFRCPKCKASVLLKIGFNIVDKTYDILGMESLDNSYFG